MSFKLVSAILGSAWAIQPEWAHKHMPLVLRLLEGQDVNFGLQKKGYSDDGEPKEQNPIAILVPETQASVYGVYPGANISRLPGGSIAVLDITGPVTKYGGACSYGMVDYAATMQSLADSPNVSGIILHIDSPGGQVDGTTLLGDVIKSTAAQKPVVAMVNDGMAASAGYWLASSASEIYTTKKSDTVGSIGVYMTLADMTGYYEQKGIKVRDIYADQSTDKNGAYREALKGNDAPIKEELNATASDFINTVKQNRGDRLKGTGWDTGKMFRADKAKRLGLIDGVKSFDQIIKRVQQLQTQATNMENGKVATATGDGLVAFAAIMAATGMAAITVTDDGFAFEESNLNALESHLAAQNSQIETLTAQLHQALADNANLSQENGQVATLQETIGGLNENIATLNQTITDRDARIAELEARTDGSFKGTVKEADDLGGKTASKYLTSFDAEKQALREKYGK